jgi:hypothetical protein
VPNSARSDLSGGRGVTRVPTGKALRMRLRCGARPSLRRQGSDSSDDTLLRSIPLSRILT